ncbi:MAG: hypothetical protein WD049_01375 [Candidatus Paceibacterota bacterium]
MTLQVRGSALFLLSVVACPLLGQEPAFNTADAAQEPSIERQAIDRTLTNLKFYFPEERTKPLQWQLHIVLRWPNLVRATNDGATAIWTQDGRPRAVCCTWTDFNGILSLGPGLLSEKVIVAELDGETIWRPRSLGPSMTAFRAIPETTPVATLNAQRLREMRLLAKRFKADLGDASDRETLRLLATPIYRYEIPTKRDGPPKEVETPDVLDGAIFAFAHGTDPETLLMIEARRSAESYQWQYAAVKRTGGPIRLFLDGELVASLAGTPMNDREADFTWWEHTQIMPTSGVMP